MSAFDKAAEQLKRWKEENEGEKQLLTTGTGAPLGCKTASLTVGKQGPALIQDFTLIDELGHFARERIPERVVHAKGTGCFGYFEVTHDITRYCKAKIFESIGKRTPLVARFSTGTKEKGSYETVRDIRGLAVKFYTEEGNWDFLGLNIPQFFIRDAILFPNLVHCFKRNPETNLWDFNQLFDFMSLRPESLQSMLFFFSERNIPDGYRHMDAHAGHAFKMINDKGEVHFVKIAIKPDQQVKNLTKEKANRLLMLDGDYATRDLYNAIASGNFPTYTLKIQVMTEEQARNNPFNPFDLTKVWPHKEFPLIPVGRLVMNRNPKNHFTDIEQVAFNPGNLVRGIEVSPDKVLHARVFSYPDTHRHRLGANFLQLPINCPIMSQVNNYQRDGPQCFTNNFGGAPNYYPNSFGGPDVCSSFLESKPHFCGDVGRYDLCDEDDYIQPRTFWEKVLNPTERQQIVETIAELLKFCQECVQKRSIKVFSNVSPQLGQMVSEALKKEMLNSNL